MREQTAIKAAEEAEKEALREAARRAAPSISPRLGGGGSWGNSTRPDLDHPHDQLGYRRSTSTDTAAGGTSSPEELEHFRRILDGELDPTRTSSTTSTSPAPRRRWRRYAKWPRAVGGARVGAINFASPGPYLHRRPDSRHDARRRHAELIARLRELRARLDKIEAQARRYCRNPRRD